MDLKVSDKFKVDFKFYKRKCPPPDYSRVLDFSKLPDDCSVKRIGSGNSVECNVEETLVAALMKPPEEWNIYELTDKPGLLFIENPFTTEGQRYWIYRCLKDYTRPPNRLNIDSHDGICNSQDWWEMCQGQNQNSEMLRNKLRWATLGYHHDWDTKVYNENMRDIFPADLAALSRYVNRSIDKNQGNFNAEAAIVNFYHFDSTLSGHTDHSEMDMSAPLFSFSFGQTAIFLLGGTTLDVAPTAMFIRSGDIVIMSKDSRQCYHGIPKILAAEESPWDYLKNPLTRSSSANLYSSASESKFDSILEREKMICHRNIIRNLFDDEFWDFVKNPLTRSSESKFVSIYEREKMIGCHHNILRKLLDDKFWKPFKEYIEQARINMNVRQVLCRGETTLPNKFK